MSRGHMLGFQKFGGAGDRPLGLRRVGGPLETRLTPPA